MLVDTLKCSLLSAFSICFDQSIAFSTSVDKRSVNFEAFLKIYFKETDKKLNPNWIGTYQEMITN